MPTAPPNASTREPVPPGARSARARWWARGVTYGLVLALVAASLLHVEAWPVTSFQLFSRVRTGETNSLEVIAVDTAGSEHPVVLGAAAHRMGNPAHQLAATWHAPPAEQRRRLLEWLDAAGLDPADYVVARIDEVRWRLDADGRRAEELRRTVVVEVAL